MKKARILLATLAIVGIVGGAVASKFNAAAIYINSTYGTTVFASSTLSNSTTIAPGLATSTAYYTTILGATITNSVPAGFTAKAE